MNRHSRSNFVTSDSSCPPAGRVKRDKFRQIVTKRTQGPRGPTNFLCGVSASAMFQHDNPTKPTHGNPSETERTDNQRSQLARFSSSRANSIRHAVTRTRLTWLRGETDIRLSCVAVAVLAPTLRQHVFILRFQHGKPPDLLEIPGKARVTDSERPSCDLRDQGGSLLFEIRALTSLVGCERARRAWPALRGS
jgi:hypothetical protein